MKILMAIDTNIQIEEVSNRLLHFLNIYNTNIIYFDVFHTYERPFVKGANLRITEMEIIENERFYQIELMQKIRRSMETQITENSQKRCIINTYLEEGDFFDKINKQLSTKKYDLLVLEPTQRDSFEKFFRKDKVKQLIEQDERPILVLPKTDDLLNSSFRLVGLIKNLDTLDYVRDLPVFQLAKADRKMLLHIGDEIANHPEIDTIPAKDGKTVDETFIEYVKAHKGKHLYIIDHQKRNGLMDFFKRSFTQNLLAGGDMNLMVV